MTDSTRFALALVGAALACALSLAGDSRADNADARAIGYDHVWHEGQVSVAGKEAVPCQRCHAMTKSGELARRPDHTSCYGDCHGPMPARRILGRPYEILEDRARQCRTCHTPRALLEATAGGRKALTVAYPPYRRDPDHGLRMSHAAHDPSARASANDCATCHRTWGPKTGARPARAAVHRRCAVCHGKAIDALVGEPSGAPVTHGRMAPMTECGVCHEQAYGPRNDPSIVPGTFPVTQTFSHERHAARAPLACRQCHAAIANADGAEMPPPTMESCASCHDGKQAFATTGPHCRRCHTTRSTKLKLRSRQLARFSHRDHRVEAGDCERCHQLDARGVPEPPAADHQPCANQGCHREQFSALEPTICTTCHLDTEPWRPLHFDRPPAATTEFGARFSHARHLGEAGVKRTCRACHQRADRNQYLRLPRDHNACQGSACHRREGGPAPLLTQCRKCHAADQLGRRERSRLSSSFSVRARFRHDTHERDPRTGADTVCTGCHVGVDRAETIDVIPTPTKAACKECHDGTVAFKVTGHGCARCHGKVAGKR